MKATLLNFHNVKVLFSKSFKSIEIQLVNKPKRYSLNKDFTCEGQDFLKFYDIANVLLWETDKLKVNNTQYQVLIFNHL